MADGHRKRMGIRNLSIHKGLGRKADGQEVVNIDGTVGYVNKHIVTPESCDIIKSNRRTTLRNAVKCLLLMDKHAQLHEVINMLCMDKKRLERRLKAINKELAQKELELHKVEKELMKWTRS